MRLWSLHPKYLDSKGLVALWRETLLAQKVLQGQTRGYKNHPQLNRFKSHSNPLAAIATYLQEIYLEAESRNYNFNRRKIGNDRTTIKILVTQGQMEYEWTHLMAKLEKRDPERYLTQRDIQSICSHKLFKTIPGPPESWEII